VRSDWILVDTMGQIAPGVCCSSGGCGEEEFLAVYMNTEDKALKDRALKDTAFLRQHGVCNNDVVVKLIAHGPVAEKPGRDAPSWTPLSNDLANILGGTPRPPCTSRLASSCGAFSGAWETPVGDGQMSWHISSNKMFYIVEDLALLCSNRPRAQLTFAGSGMVIEGSVETGILSETKNSVHFSNGGAWQRASFEGIWNPTVGSEGSRSIYGDVMTTRTGEQVRWENRLQIMSRTRVSMVASEGNIVTGSLDEFAMELTWSNGELWHRVFAEDSTFAPRRNPTHQADIIPALKQGNALSFSGRSKRDFNLWPAIPCT